jgi:hypothetical protein
LPLQWQGFGQSPKEGARVTFSHSNPHDAQLRRLDRVKRSDLPTGALLGPEMVQFFKQSVEKRQTKMGQIAACWGRIVPEMFSEHCALESYVRGTLSVIVDSSSHLYELKQLLLAGLEQQLKLGCKSAGLRKINLKHGRWYQDDGIGNNADRKVRFSR